MSNACCQHLEDDVGHVEERPIYVVTIIIALSHTELEKETEKSSKMYHFCLIGKNRYFD